MPRTRAASAVLPVMMAPAKSRNVTSAVMARMLHRVPSRWRPNPGRLRSDVVVQLGLFAGGSPGFDPTFSGVERRALAGGAWVDYAASWVSGQDALFAALERSTRWRTDRRWMYDRMVDTPRLIATLPDDGPGHPVLEAIRAALSARYSETFQRTTLALYRDGRDSVAFHGDTVARDMDQALVATVSLGTPRRFLLKPAAGGPSISYPLGRGDLLVMGGTCQRTWRHSIPKVTASGPRMAIMFRPTWYPD
jgi:alkylated DNA repair dioxygenase AlkB